MNWGELLDTLGIALCIGGGVVCSLGHAPWYAFLFPGTGVVLFGLRAFARAI